MKPRHGIYRNIPVRGRQSYKDKENKEHKFLYYADVKLNLDDVNTSASYDNKDGNFILKLGDEEAKVNSGNYQFSYQLTPYHQEKNIIMYITMYFLDSGKILFRKEVGLRYIFRRR